MRYFPKTRTLVIALGILALAVPAVYALKQRSAPAKPEVVKVEQTIELAASDVAQVELTDIARTIPLTGTLQPRDWTSVKTQVAGEVRQVLVREGEAVRKGQVLARVETADLKARLDDRIGSLQGAKAQLSLAETTRAKNLELLKQKFISQTAYDSMQSNYAVSESTVKSLEAQVAIARKALADAEIKAAMDGVISERFVQAGEKMPVDGKLFTLMNLTQMEMEAAVPANDIPNVQVGQAVAFSVDGYGARIFSGEVNRINPATQAGSQSISVFIVMPNTDLALKGGMFAKGSLQIARLDKTATIPLSSLRDDNGLTFVYQISGGKVAKTPVKLGVRDETRGVVQVIEGLIPGATVVRTNLGALREGNAVKIGSASS